MVLPASFSQPHPSSRARNRRFREVPTSASPDAAWPEGPVGKDGWASSGLICLELMSRTTDLRSITKRRVTTEFHMNSFSALGFGSEILFVQVPGGYRSAFYARPTGYHLLPGRVPNVVVKLDGLYYLSHCSKALHGMLMIPLRGIRSAAEMLLAVQRPDFTAGICARWRRLEMLREAKEAEDAKDAEDREWIEGQREKRKKVQEKKRQGKIGQVKKGEGKKGQGKKGRK